MTLTALKPAPQPAHSFPIRVYYEDTDAGGIVYYANYLKFAERARTEMLREAGFHHTAMMNAEGIALAVRRCAAEYQRPAKLDDLLDVSTTVTGIGAATIDLESQARKDLERIEKLGLGHAPVCMAKTHLSLSHDPALRNRPTGFILPIRGLVPSAGAEFVVALCGEMQRMPGLGKAPAFMNIDIDGEGRTIGLF